MSDAQETAVLAEGNLQSVKDLRRVITRAGIEAHIVRPPAAGNT